MNQKYFLGQVLLTKINNITYKCLVIERKWNPFSNESEYEVELLFMGGDKEWIMESDLFVSPQDKEVTQ